MVTLVISGFFRGATLINFALTISEHCSLEKLPAAFGLHMVAKGLFIAALGPVGGETHCSQMYSQQSSYDFQSHYP
jgi:hypothetical protein